MYDELQRTGSLSDGRISDKVSRDVDGVEIDWRDIMWTGV